jgi:hypothetical protein
MTTGRINQVNILHTKEDEKPPSAQITTQGPAANTPQPPKNESRNIARSLSHSRHYSRESFLHPSGTERQILDPHFNSPVETEQEANNRARRSTHQALTLDTRRIHAPDLVRFYPKLNLPTGFIPAQIAPQKASHRHTQPESHTYTIQPTAASLCTSSDRASL